MRSERNDPALVRISRNGRVRIPKSLCETAGFETPRNVFLYDEGDRIVVEPIPSAEDLHGIHAGDHEDGEIREKVRDERESEERREG